MLIDLRVAQCVGFFHWRLTCSLFLFLAVLTFLFPILRELSFSRLANVLNVLRGRFLSFGDGSVVDSCPSYATSAGPFMMQHLQHTCSEKHSSPLQKETYTVKTVDNMRTC